MITVRTARISDIPEMAIMGREFYDTIPQADMDDYSEAYMGGVLVGLLEHPASTLFVAYDGDKLVGITGALASPKWLVRGPGSPSHESWQEDVRCLGKVGRRYEAQVLLNGGACH